ncbi:MAG TPA: CRISPR-associated endoribonuclease Cas6 [Mesoaciditoga lauensis]|uniref:CRISPR-associated endoribonuclease n=1 Tax=Caldisericum exile TaxID=693075 RepID=A0A2J6X938_9BACT|nr:MAG: CRISPR-associated endoribonuclease Cas6 [Caldisericum exile]HEU23500.1 CRISPR-associated endoribonuclease Cas6 [Mesoaciditoga lauensis]
MHYWRLNIKVRLELISEGEVRLPIAYNYLIQSMIYALIEDRFPNLHDVGFEYEKRRLKLFTFSQIYSQKYQVDGKFINFSSPLYIFVSSPIDELIDVLANKMLRKEKLRIGNNCLTLSRIDPIIENFDGCSIKVKAVSPITVYTTSEDGHTYYHSPDERIFDSLIKSNIQKKAFILGLNTDEKSINFSIESLNSDKKNSKVTFYKNFLVRGWTGKFKIEGDEWLLKIALSAGLGAKNSQGFGMVVLEEVKIWDF